MFTQLLPGFRLTLLLTVLTGLVYPALVTGLCQALFREQANGSLITRNGQVAGSHLIGQSFGRPEYFHPRPSAAGADGYDAANSGGSNLGPTNKKLIDRTQADVARLRASNPNFTGSLPADLATASGSGLDPHLSPASVEFQLERVARARNVSVEAVRPLIASLLEGRDLGFLGEPRVNVLRLNIALDEQFPMRR